MTGIGEEFWTQTRRDGGKQTTVPKDNAVENAWALAIKRAAHAFGLGLYLRNLPECEGVPYQYQGVRVSLNGTHQQCNNTLAPVRYDREHFAN